MEGNERMMPAPDGEQEMNGQPPEREASAKEKKKKNKPLIEKWIFFACAIISIVAVAAIVVFILINSIPAFAEIGFFNFIFGTEWYPNGYSSSLGNASEVFGILPMIVCSICVTLFSLLCGGILGVCSALFVVYWCPKKMKKTVEQLINVFAGIPSVIYGFFGLVMIVPMLRSIAGNGFGIMACTLVLMLMILPTIANMSKNALESVPASYYEGAMALGMTKEQAIFTVMLPAAKSGIISGLIMGMGRAVGEAMAVALVAGGSPSFPHGLFSNIRTMTSSIALEMGYAYGLQRNALIATGLVLLVFVLILNFVISRINRDKDSSGDKRKKVRAGAASTDAGTKGDSIVRSVAAVATANTGATIGDLMSGSITRTVPEYKKKGLFSLIAKYACFVVAAFAGACLVLIVGFILINGLPNLAAVFNPGAPGDLGTPHLVQFGNALFGTVVLIVLTLVIALPLGVCAAVYLHEYAKPGSKIVKAIRLFNDTLGGVPSIVFGLFGNIVFVEMMGMSQCILAGTLTMVLVILPTIIRSVEESLIAVPDSLREASLALGASKLQTIWKVVIPQALAGILTATVLSIGRIVGESAALIYTMGGSRSFLPEGLVGRGNASCTLTVYMYSLASDGQEIGVAYGIAIILLFIVALVYVGLGLIEYFSKKEKGQKKHKEKIKPPEVTA